jgi:hypothetical protein
MCLGVVLQDDAAAAQWFPVDQPPSLAFDHKLILREAFETLTQRPDVNSNCEDSAWLLRSASQAGCPACQHHKAFNTCMQIRPHGECIL